ncbi:apolipoprotein N-acyltransferase [Quadrisphaera sp. DSM 44207]|nr:apolipoprotein N-acyltransferase [Quadrisphaera sp. DSM 44207]
MLAVAGRRVLPAALVGFVFGLALCVPLLSWAGVYIGPVAWLPLSAAEALFSALVAALAAVVLRAPGGPLVRSLAVGAVWAGVEALQARFPFGGFGWTRIAFSQADAPTLGLAALGGAPLVSAAVAAAGALGAHAVIALHRRRARSAAALAAGAVAAVGAGLLVPAPTAAQAGSLEVAAVQGDVPRAGLDFNAQRRAVLDNHVDGTLRLAEEVAAGQRAAPALVVWPENASDIDPLRNADAAAQVERAAAAAGAPLLLGAVLRSEDPGEPDGVRLTNTSLLWQAGVGPVAAYDKRDVAPFAEYIPHRALFRAITSAVDLRPVDFDAGTQVGVVDAAGARLGVLICFEVVADDLAADAVDAGAQLLVVQTNNATFGYTDESVQQLAMSRLRAVEHGRAVVHASTVGVSSLITPDGTALQRTALFEPALLQEQLPLRTSSTVADRLRRAGVPVEGVLVVLGAGAVLAGALAGRRARA